MFLPVTRGNDTGTVLVPFGVDVVGTFPSRAVTGALPSALILMRVGSEWRPSATTWRSRWSKLTAFGSL